MKTHVLKALLFSATILGFASPAEARDETGGQPSLQDEATIKENAPASPGTAEKQDPLLVSDEELQGQRGGQTIQIANQTMTAITSGNVINGDYRAGDVTLSDNALANFNGVGNLLINTGAQVSLQTGMNLTINMGE